MHISAQIIGTAVGLTKAGAGTLALSGANSYTGTTTISTGTLQLGNGGTTGSLSTSSAIVDNANFTINRSNAVTQGTDFSGAPITGAAGSFTQAGSGTTTLNAANTYGGGTTVNAGTLLVNNTTGSGTGTGNVTVNSSGTLGGTGTISGSVTVNSGGNLSPGNSPGILNTGSVTLNATSNFKIDINGTTVGTQYDQLNVAGIVTLNGGNLMITVGGPLLRGEMFTIINNDSTDAVVGTFAGLAEGATFDQSGQRFTISYVGGSGNDVVLAVAPEPSTWIGGALAVAALAYLQRRRLAGLLKRKLA
jgi:autotransporter-associated beta strand protein